MRDARDPDFAPTPEVATASRAARLVSDRLEGRRAAEGARPPTRSPAVPMPATSPSTVELPLGRTTRPALAADEPSSDPARAAAVPPAAVPPTIDRAVASRLLGAAPAEVPDPPTVDLGPKGLDGGPIGLAAPPPGSIMDRPALEPAVRPGFAPDFATPGIPGRLDEPSPPIGDEAAGWPGVRGRLPAAAANLALAPAGPPGREPSAGASDPPPAMNDAAWSDLATASPRGIEGGATADLAQTNDLLRQILDAIRKPNVAAESSLPKAAPSVYAERF